MINLNTAVASPYAGLNQGSAGKASSATTPSAQSQAEVDQFMAYANMTPAQRMRADILSSMGLSEDDLKAMDPQQRAAVEQKIEKMVQDKVMQNAEKKAAGQVVDISV